MPKLTHELVRSVQTYKATEATSRGYDIDFYLCKTDHSIGYAILTFHSNWQGEEDGRKYKADIPGEVLRALNSELMSEVPDHEPDLEAAVHTWMQNKTTDDWQLIRL
jgi:hypothetical protein